MGFNRNLVEAFDQTGDIVTALVLTQIRFWHTPNKQGKSKLTAKPGWLIKSHKEWWGELRLTRQQVRTALDKLKRMGAIETKVAKFRNSPTTHIRFIGLVTSNQSIGSQQPILYTENTYIGKELSKDSSCSVAWPNVHAFPSKGKKMANSQEVLKKLEEKKKQVVVVKNTNDLVTAWERLVPRFHKEKIGESMKPLTNKESGVLSQYLKAVGKDCAYGVMSWVIENWFAFSLEVNSLKGDTMPQLPHPGLLLKHWNIALKGYRASLQLTAKEGNTVVKFLTKQELKAKLVSGG